MSHVLVIDDSHMVSSLLRELLSSHGYDVAVSASAQEAYHAVQKTLPDLILLDVQLPDVNGVELCKYFRTQALTRHIPIIMITGTAHQSHEKVRGFQAGADDYIVKPFDSAELLERARAVMRRASRPAVPAVTPAAAGLRSSLSVDPSAPPKVVSLPIGMAVYRALFSPDALPAGAVYPGLNLAYGVTLMALLTAGLTLAAGVSTKPLLVCLFALLIWGAQVSVLVVGSSILGMPMKWKEGGSLISLAYLPLLLKFLGGCVLAGWTTLSPLLFTAGPALFVTSPPFWLYRVDLFEFWSAWLLMTLLGRHKGTSQSKILAVAALVFLVSAFLLAGLQVSGGSQ